MALLSFVFEVQEYFMQLYFVNNLANYYNISIILIFHFHFSINVMILLGVKRNLLSFF